MERRYKFIRVTSEFFLDLLRNELLLCRFIGIPKDAQVYGVYYDDSCACIKVILYHKSWRELAEAEIIPELTYTITMPTKHTIGDDSCLCDSCCFARETAKALSQDPDHFRIK